jgi:hypothetical protein
LISFFEVEGIVQREFVRPEKNSKSAVLLECVETSPRQKRPEKWQSGDWFLHHENAPAHTVLTA